MPNSDTAEILGNPAASPGGVRRQILLVEDEVPFRELVQAFLREEGFDVHAVADGKYATRWLRENPADVVITDLCMPNTDGIELLIALRRIRSTVRIVVMSGGVAGDVDGMLRAAKLLGARHVLAKPFELQQLARAVHESVSGAS